MSCDRCKGLKKSQLCDMLGELHCMVDWLETCLNNPDSIYAFESLEKQVRYSVERAKEVINAIKSDESY